jgi:hypothetical protein
MIYKTIHCILLKDISRGNPPLSINKKNLSDSILKVDVHLFCMHWLLSIVFRSCPLLFFRLTIDSLKQFSDRHVAQHGKIILVHYAWSSVIL